MRSSNVKFVLKSGFRFEIPIFCCTFAVSNKTNWIMKKKYRFTDETREWKGCTLHRIEALMSFGNVKKGELGGWIEKEENLSHDGDCWVRCDAKVWGNALVCGNAQVRGCALVSDNAEVSDNADVYGYVRVSDKAQVYDNAKVNGKAVVCDHARVYGNALVCGNAVVSGCADVYGYALVHGNAVVSGCAEVHSNADVSGDAQVHGDAQVCGYSVVSGNAVVRGNAVVSGNADVSGDAVIEKNADYLVFKNFWSSGRFFTWTKSNNKWQVGCFYGTGEELIKKAFADSKKKGEMYKSYVEFVESVMKKYESLK